MAEEIAIIHQAGIFVVFFCGYFQAEGEKKIIEYMKFNYDRDYGPHRELRVCSDGDTPSLVDAFFASQGPGTRTGGEPTTLPAVWLLLNNHFRNTSPALEPKVVSLPFLKPQEMIISRNKR